MENMENEEKELSFERMMTKCIMKYRRLFPEIPILWRSAKVVNIQNHERGAVLTFTLNDVEIVHSDNRKSRVRLDDLMEEKVYDQLMGTLTLACIFYKGNETPAILVSEGTYLLACREIFEKYLSMLVIPRKEKLKGTSRERYYEHFREFLSRISWADKTPDEIQKISDAEIDDLVVSQDFTLDKVRERILDIYKIEPCETCTVPLTCDCRQRIVQLVRGDDASSYHAAQNVFREQAKLMSFLLKGVFRGKPRVRWVDYDTWLQERLDQDFDPKWVKILSNSIREYESWSHYTVDAEVIQTLQEAVKKLGFTSLEDLEVAK